MAVETTTITGKVLQPSGVPASGGRLRARLSSPGTINDAGVTQKINGVAEAEIGSDGSVNFKLVPNDAISPAGSIYAVEFQMPDGSSWREYWNLPTNPDPTEIGDVPRVNA
jgi:hypothetical protein